MENIRKNSTYLTRSTTDTGLLEMADDFLLPEHLDDAKRIIRCDGTLRPGGRYVSGREVEYEGEMVFSVLYLTDTNSIKNAVFRSRYTKSITVPEGAENDYSVLPTASGVECKLVNPRKLNLRAKIDLGFLCMKKSDCAPTFSGSTPDEDSASCEMKQETAFYSKSITCEKKDIRSSRDFELPAGAKPIKEIVNCFLTINDVEQTVHDGSFDSKAEALFSCVYLVKNDEDVEYACAQQTFRLEGSIPCNDLLEECEGIVHYYVKELSVSVSRGAEGENTVIEMDFSYDICARFFANGECYPVTDMYSCDYECNCEHKEFGVTRYHGCYEAAAPFRSTVDAPHISDFSAKDAHVSMCQVRYDENEHMLYADASISVSAVQRSEDGRFSAFASDIPVRVRFENSDGASGEYLSDAAVKNFEMRLHDGVFELSGELSARVFCFENDEIEIVSAISVDHDKPRADVSGLPITFYYPDENESLWDIAKKYASTEEIIRNANDITDDRKIGKSVLLIPCKRKKPLFSKVITK